MVRASLALTLFAALALATSVKAQLPEPAGPDVVRGEPSDHQVRVQWGPPDEQDRNAISAGFGTVVGFFGARYQRFLAPTPLSVWAGAGGMGAGVGLEVTLPRLVIGDAAQSPIHDWEGYISLGALQDWAGGPPYAGSIVLEVGLRRWYGRRSMYLDVALGGRREVWGTPSPETAPAIRVLMAKVF